MVLLIGLAVGVDYSMFYLKRERQERAAGKSARGGARGRRGDLRPLGADLRPDRDGRDGRDVPDRRPDLRVARLRHDPRRRGGGARLADGAARAALAARRQRRPAARPVHRPAPPGRRRGPFLGRDRRSRAAPARACRRPSRRACWSRWPLPALGLRLAPQGAESFPQSLTVIKTYHQMQQAFPGKALPANVVVKAPNVRTPAARSAIAELKRRALASGRAFEPITVDVNRAGRSRTSPSRSRGTAPTPPRTTPSAPCAGRSSPRRSARFRARRRA